MCMPQPKMPPVLPVPPPVPPPPPPPPPAATASQTTRAVPNVTTATAVRSRKNPLAVAKKTGDSVSTGLNIPV